MKGVFINMKTAFDFYESNKKEINKNLIDIIIYSVMSNYIDLEDKKTCSIFHERILKAYMKDEEHIDLIHICDFLCQSFKDKKFTLEDLENASHWEILQSVYDNDLKLTHQKTMENIF